MPSRSRSLLATIQVVILAFAGTLHAGDGKSEAAKADVKYDKAFAMQYLEESRQKFIQSFEHMSEAQWKFKAAPDRWSAAEAAEHVVRAEEMFTGLVQKTMSAPIDPAKIEAAKGKEAGLIKAVTDRSTKFQAPDILKPTGRWATRAELMAAFEKLRQANIENLANNYDEMRKHVATDEFIAENDAGSCSCSWPRTPGATPRRSRRSKPTPLIPRSSCLYHGDTETRRSCSG